MKKTIASILAGTAIGAPMTLASSINAPVAAAQTPSNCVEQFWMVGLRGATRTICDGPIQADGSWTRQRQFFAAAFTAAGISTCYGYGICTFTMPRDVPEMNRRDTYRVTIETVLPDEPQHIDVAGTAA